MVRGVFKVSRNTLMCCLTTLRFFRHLLQLNRWLPQWLKCNVNTWEAQTEAKSPPSMIGPPNSHTYSLGHWSMFITGIGLFNWTVPWGSHFSIYNIRMMIIIIFPPMALNSPPAFWGGRDGSPFFEMPFEVLGEFVFLENLGWVERHCTVCDPGLYK